MLSRSPKLKKKEITSFVYKIQQFWQTSKICVNFGIFYKCVNCVNEEKSHHLTPSFFCTRIKINVWLIRSRWLQIRCWFLVSILFFTQKLYFQCKNLWYLKNRISEPKTNVRFGISNLELKKNTFQLFFFENGGKLKKKSWPNKLFVLVISKIAEKFNRMKRWKFIFFDTGIKNDSTLTNKWKLTWNLRNYCIKISKFDTLVKYINFNNFHPRGICKMSKVWQFWYLFFAYSMR